MTQSTGVCKESSTTLLLQHSSSCQASALTLKSMLTNLYYRTQVYAVFETWLIGFLVQKSLFSQSLISESLFCRIAIVWSLFSESLFCESLFHTPTRKSFLWPAHISLQYILLVVSILIFSKSLITKPTKSEFVRGFRSLSAVSYTHLTLPTILLV